MMTVKKLSRLLPLTALILAGNVTTAQTSTVRTVELPKRYHDVARTSKTLYHFNHGGTVDQSNRPTKTRAGEAACTLTCNIIYDADKGEQPDFQAFGYDASTDFPDSWAVGFYDFEGSYTFDLAPGTYNLWFNVSSPRGMIFIARENVTVTGDMTLSLNTAEATNHITFTSLNPQGEEIKTDLLDPATDFTTVLDPGNALESTWGLDLVLFYHGRFSYAWLTDCCRKLLDDGTEVSLARNEYSVWVNDNNCLSFGRVDSYGNSDGMGCVKHYAPDSRPRDLINDPNDYVTVTENYISSPYKTPIDPDDPWSFPINDCAVSRHYLLDKNGVCGFGSHTTLSEDKLYVKNNVLHICSRPDDVFNIWNTVAEAKNIDPFYGHMEGAKVRINADKSVTRISIAPHSAPEQPLRNAEGKIMDVLDPRFTLNNEPKVAYGESAPFAVIYPTPYYDGSVYTFDYYFGGFMGEVRLIDRLVAEVTMKINGRQILDNADGINDLFSGWWSNPLEKGKIELDITNTNHATEDGIPGINTVHMEYDTRLDDCEAPTLRGLIIKDESDSPTIIFETASEASRGLVELAANDQRLSSDSWAWFALDNPAPEVTVEYAPYSSESFQAIEITEKPEWFSAPGYGRHFTGQLPEVTEKSAHGWYDLRITLTDAAGNLQRQLISPAFQVKEMASIGNIDPEIQEPVTIAVYNLQGIRIDYPDTKGVYIELMGNGTSRKVLR